MWFFPSKNLSKTCYIHLFKFVFVCVYMCVCLSERPLQSLMVAYLGRPEVVQHSPQENVDPKKSKTKLILMHFFLSPRWEFSQVFSHFCQESTVN